MSLYLVQFVFGKVLAVGPGSRDDNGNRIAMDVEEGDEIVFSKYGGTEIKVGVDEFLILRESDVLAKVVGAAGQGQEGPRRQVTTLTD